MPSIRKTLPLALATLALVLAGCGSDDDTTDEETGAGVAEPATTAPEPSPDRGNALPPSGDAARSEKVDIVEFVYEPDPVTIEEGGKVIWMNRDAAPHTATADDGSFDTGTIEQGKLQSESFKQPGTYPYFCEIHPDMRGTVEVVESG